MVCVAIVVYWSRNHKVNTMALFIPRSGPRPAPMGASHPPSGQQPVESSSTGPHRITGREIKHMEDRLRRHLGLQARAAVQETIDAYRKEHHISPQSGFDKRGTEKLIEHLEEKRGDLGLGRSALGHVTDTLTDALKH